MAIIKCEGCGKHYSDKAEQCPFCSLAPGDPPPPKPAPKASIASRVAPAARALSQKAKQLKKPLAPPAWPPKPIHLDCHACNNQQTMMRDTVPRFNCIIRTIGGILLIPSLLGVAVSLIGLFTTCTAHHEVMQDLDPAYSTAGAMGATIGATISGGIFLVLGVGAFVGGLLGWLLLLTRKVYKCTVCGHIIERA